MKYSFVIPYYNRVTLWNTLLSFDHFYKGRTDYEVLILEDKKNAEHPEWHPALMEILRAYPQLPIVYRRMNYTNWSCPCSTINDGVDIAKGEYVIMTNPECMHYADVLKGFDEELAKGIAHPYIICGCMSVGCDVMKANTFEEYTYVANKWYQHSVHNPYHLNFCTLISKADYIRIEGFNEEFDKGIGRADVEFINLIGRSGFNIILRDDLLVLHQHHVESYPTERKHELVSINHSVTKGTSRFNKIL